MKKNRYFIIENIYPNFKEIMQIVVGNEDTQRKSNDGNFTVVKLPIDTNSTHDIFKKYKEYNHEQVLKELEKDNWTKKGDLINNEK